MRLGPYELIQLIGSGGMGEVWAAHEMTRGPHELIAVKRLPERLARDPAYRQTLLDEARLSMLLHHPNIVNVFEAGEDDGQTYIAMEFVSGLDLSRLRKILETKVERLPTVVVAYVIAEVLRGLDYAHNLVHGGELLSLIHRDISPHNIMLATDGAVKITDFGVARLSTEDTSGTHVKGKARYMPPEQLRGESRSATVDLFAVGAVMQELLDGALFRAEAQDDARLLGMAVDGYVPPPQRTYELPRELLDVLAGLLQPEAHHRFPTAAAALEAIQAWPGFADASATIAELIQTQLEDQIAKGAMSSHTDLARQATFLHTQDAIEVEPDEPPPDDFGGLDSGVHLESLLLSPEDPMPGAGRTQDSSPPKPAPGSRRPTGGHAKLPSGSHRSLPSYPGGSRPPSASHSSLQVRDEPGLELELELDDGIGPIGSGEPDRDNRPLTGGHQALELDDTDRAHPSKLAGRPSPELAIDPNILRRPSAPATGSRATARPPRPWAKYLVRTLVVAGLGVGAWFAYPHIPGLIDQAKERVRPTPPEGPATLRYARIVGTRHAGFVGFRLPHLDKLTTEGDIFYNFVPPAKTEADSPLAALAAGEAEFALTSLDQLLAARASEDLGPALGSAKVIAVVDLSLGAHGLVLDSAEYPQLTSLAALTTFAGQPGQTKPLVAHVAHTPSAALWAQLDGLLADLDGSAVELSTEHGDAAAVFAALAKTAPLPEPALEDGGEAEESETGEPEPPPPPEPQVVAATLPEPWLGQARAAGMKVVLSSRSLPYSLVTVLVASEAIVRDHPDIVSAIFEGYYAGLGERTGPARAEALATQLGVSAEEAESSLDGVCILDAAGAAKWLVDRGEAEPPPLLAAAVSAVWATLQLRGVVSGPAPRLADFVDAELLRAHVEAQTDAGSGVDLGQCLDAAGTQGSAALGLLALDGLPGPWFEAESAELNAAGRAAVDPLRARLRNFNPNTLRAQITGYGTSRKLGKARAQALVAALQAGTLDLDLVPRGAKAGAEDPLIRVELVQR